MLKKKKEPAKTGIVEITSIPNGTKTYGIYKDEYLVKTFKTKEEAEEQAAILGLRVE